MALETSDIFPVQKTAGGNGSVRKATVGALLALAQTTSSFWQRTDDTLSPVNSGDDLEGINEIKAVEIELSGDIQAVNASFSGTLSADIDGGEYAT